MGRCTRYGLDVEALWRAMDAAGADVKALARAAGVSYEAAHRWVLADRPAQPSLSSLCSVAAALGVPPEGLIREVPDGA